MKKALLSCLTFLPVLGLYAQQIIPRLVVPSGHTRGITSLDISPDGQFFLTGSIDNTAKIWDWAGHELNTLVGHENEVLSVAFSPKTAENPEGGKYILTGSSDFTALLWDDNGKVIDTFEHTRQIVTSVAFSPDGKYFATGSEDSTAQIWSRAQKTSQILRHSDKVYSVTFSPDGNDILTACRNKTAVLWNRAGEVKQVFSGEHLGSVLCAVFSPSGDSILTGSSDGTAILWTVKGEKIQKFRHSKQVRSVAFSPDGKSIVTGSSNGTLHIWEISTPEPDTIQAFTRGKLEGSPGMGVVKFSPDGAFVMSCSEREHLAKIFSVADGHLFQSLKGHTSAINDLALSPDAKLLLTSHVGRSAKLWSVLGHDVRTIRWAGKPGSVHFSPPTGTDSLGGRYMLIGSEDKMAVMEDMTGNDVRFFKQASLAVFSPDGKSVLTGYSDGTTRLWNLATKESADIKHSEKKVTALAFSPNGKSFAIGSDEGAIIYWENLGAEPVYFPKKYTSSAINAIDFSPDGKLLAIGAKSGLTEIRDLAGAVKKEYPNRFTSTNNVRSVAFSPKSKRDNVGGGYVLRATGNDAELWDVATNKVKVFSGHTSEVTAVAFSPIGILTGSKDGTVKLWDIPSETEMATLISLDSSDWVVLTPSGLFDASPGAMRLMYYIYNKELLEFKQLKTRFYEPYLFQKILGLKPGGIRPVDELVDVKLYPDVTDWSIKNDVLQVKLAPRGGGGIGKVALLLDERELLADANPEHKSSFTVDLKAFQAFYSTEKKNQINLVIYNQRGDLPSRPFPLVVEDEGVSSRDPNDPGGGRTSLNVTSDQTLENIHFYALVVGTSKYRDEKLFLKYPEKDASIFADALQKAGSELFSADRTIVKLISTETQPWPRKAEIKKEIQNIAAQAGADDILLIYFSGHGLTYKAPNSEESQFYYLTTDIGGDQLKDEAILSSQAIAQDSLMDWVRKVKTRKRILIYDACNSGSVVENIEGAKDLTSDQRKALERINERSGMFVLTGSASDKKSYEASTFGHGLLTYSLLNGMLKIAAENDEYIELGDLFDFVEDDVRALAKKIDREQSPEVIKAESYPIGQIKPNTDIKMPIERNVFVRTNLNSEGADIQEVSKAINLELEKKATEKEPSLVFWEDVAPSAKPYYYLGGNYQEEAGKITGKANLFKGTVKLKSFPIDCKSNQLNKMAKDLVFDVLEFMAQNPGD